MSPFVELGFEGPLARLTLKRADKLNALDRAMIDALADAGRAIDASSEARVAILLGEGKAFCAGGDIGAWVAFSPGNVARLDAGGASRARSARAPARSAHRGDDGTRVRRRPRTRGRRRYSDRRKRHQAWPPRNGARHGPRLVGHAEARAPLRGFSRASHGFGWRMFAEEGASSASSTRWRQRARASRGRRPSRPISPGVDRSRCKWSRP